MTTPEELRALVAEEVMGWEKILVGDEPCWSVCLGWNGDARWLARQDWDPLESGADAWRVIERMVDLGFTMTLVYGPQGDDVTFYHVEDGRHGFGKGKSVPRHISLAALRALGVEVE